MIKLHLYDSAVLLISILLVTLLLSPCISKSASHSCTISCAMVPAVKNQRTKIRLTPGFFQGRIVKSMQYHTWNLCMQFNGYTNAMNFLCFRIDLQTNKTYFLLNIANDLITLWLDLPTNCAYSIQLELGKDKISSKLFQVFQQVFLIHINIKQH